MTGEGLEMVSPPGYDRHEEASRCLGVPVFEHQSTRPYVPIFVRDATMPTRNQAIQQNVRRYTNSVRKFAAGERLERKSGPSAQPRLTPVMGGG
jgi:hypothetical protein